MKYKRYCGSYNLITEDGRFIIYKNHKCDDYEVYDREKHEYCKSNSGYKLVFGRQRMAKKFIESMY